MIEWQDENMTKLFIIAIALFGPFAIWGIFYLLVSNPHVRINSLLKFIKIVRWIVWSTAVVLGLYWLVITHTLLTTWPVVVLLSIFQLGFIFPESWLKSKQKSIEYSVANDCSTIN
jgi:hypothetical protein